MNEKEEKRPIHECNNDTGDGQCVGLVADFHHRGIDAGTLAFHLSRSLYASFSKGLPIPFGFQAFVDSLDVLSFIIRHPYVLSVL
mgnify:CR=1 FL=1